MSEAGTAGLTISELREFAGFSSCEQRYIKRSLDVGLGRQDAIKLWGRDAYEVACIKRQYAVYRDLKPLRTSRSASEGSDGFAEYLAKLVKLTVFDLEQGRIESFPAYRFLYERLLGAGARPWLPAAFCGAAALPQLAPERRKLLLQSISEAAATARGWSAREPFFYPEWVEKEDA